MVGIAAAKLGLDTEETNPVLLRQMLRRKKKAQRRRVDDARRRGTKKIRQEFALWAPPWPTARGARDDATAGGSGGCAAAAGPPYTERAGVTLPPWDQRWDAPVEPELEPEPRPPKPPLPEWIQPPIAVSLRRRKLAKTWGRRSPPGESGAEAAAYRARNAPIALRPGGTWPEETVRVAERDHRTVFAKQPPLPKQPRLRQAAAARRRNDGREVGSLSPACEARPAVQQRDNRHGIAIKEDGMPFRHSNITFTTQNQRIVTRRPNPPTRRPLTPGSDRRRFHWRRLPHVCFGVVAAFLDLPSLGRLACVARRFSIKCIAAGINGSGPEMWSVIEEGARRQLLDAPAVSTQTPPNTA